MSGKVAGRLKSTWKQRGNRMQKKNGCRVTGKKDMDAMKQEEREKHGKGLETGRKLH